MNRKIFAGMGSALLLVAGLAVTATPASAAPSPSAHGDRSI
ncbi:hypothetical protein [Sinomonas susongensis]|nr:hypothetical protein [Sinomonas susongensis]